MDALKKEEKAIESANKNSSVSRSAIAQLIYLVISATAFYSGGLLLFQKMNYIIASDAYVNSSITNIMSPQDGIIKELNVGTGYVVKKNQKIALIENEKASELPIRNIETKLNETREKLLQANIYLNKLDNLLKQAQLDAENQLFLETKEAQQNLVEEKSSLKAAKANYDLVLKNYQRVKNLWEEGVYSRAQFEAVEADLQKARATVESIEATISKLEINLLAAQKGLSLNRTRSNFDPRIRVQEIEVQKNNQNQIIANLSKTIKELEEEMWVAKSDLVRNKTTTIISPVDGIIWKVNVEVGQYANSQARLLEIVDCEHRWVDALVNESDLIFIKKDSIAIMEIYGLKHKKITLLVDQIRAGVGRLSIGEETAIPLPSNQSRKVQVRLRFNDTFESFGVTDSSFCLVGYTGRIKFLKNR